MDTDTRRKGPDDWNGRIMAWTFGTFLAALFLTLRACGKVRVEGYERAVEALREGGVLVAANHPEGLTPFLIPAIFWRHYRRNPRFFLWNMPREGLVPAFLLKRLRCILVERKDPKQKKEAFDKSRRVLREGDNILVFPEGTRTFPRKPEDSFVEQNGRVMRPVSKTGVPALAFLSKASILPTWIDLPGADQKLGLVSTLKHLFAHPDHRLTILFGEPYPTQKPFNLQEENKRMQDRIMFC